MNYKDRITKRPEVRGGRPCIKGTRISVFDIVEYLASGMTPAEVVSDFPNLTIDDIEDAVSYARDQETSLA